MAHRPISHRAELANIPGGQPPSVDESVPHSARIWNYWLGGNDNFQIDKIVGAHVKTAFPGIVALAPERIPCGMNSRPRRAG